MNEKKKEHQETIAPEEIENLDDLLEVINEEALRNVSGGRGREDVGPRMM